MPLQSDSGLLRECTILRYTSGKLVESNYNRFVKELSSSCMLLALTFGSFASAAPLRTVFPAEDTNIVLHNPGMGWVLYENYPLDSIAGGSSTLVNLPREAFSEVDSVALMFSWQDIEKRQGEYDFSKADFAYHYWKARGKSIQLRLSTTSLVWWSGRNPPAGGGAPEYVLQKLSPAEKQTRTMEGIPYTVEDARNPFYRERLRAFLRAVAAHYNTERPVTLIDLRGFGVWGEWHTGFQYASLADRRSALRGILDIWSESFPDHSLALSYSYDPDGPKELYAGPTKEYDPAFTTNYSAFLDFSAFDYALTKKNITFRRDGCGGAVHSNERLLNENAFKSLDRGPFMCEFLGGYGSVKKAGTNWVNWMLEDALSLHPNYINLLGWQSGDALRFTRERPDLIARGLILMGYRLVPLRITLPSVIHSKEPMQIEMEWVNRGVGRPTQDFEITFELKGRNGSNQSQNIPLPCSRWVEGEKHVIRPTATFSDLETGPHTLSFYVRTRSGQKVSLPINHGSTDGAYDIGSLQVE
jgi:hypothetical protein